jgi:hypothetical protein
MRNCTGRQEQWIVALLAGSIWIFCEVVLGAMVKSMALPLRGTLMTCIGVGVLLMAFAFTRRAWVVATAVLVTVVGKILFTPTYGGGLWMVLNSSTAVFLEGACIFAVACFLQNRGEHRLHWVALASGAAMLCAGTAFYAVGIHLAPCPYLLQFHSAGFLLRESIPWAIASAVTAPVGFALGRQLKYRYLSGEKQSLGALPACGMIAGCWLACVVVITLIS